MLDLMEPPELLVPPRFLWQYGYGDEARSYDTIALRVEGAGPLLRELAIADVNKYFKPTGRRAAGVEFAGGRRVIKWSPSAMPPRLSAPFVRVVLTAHALRLEPLQAADLNTFAAGLGIGYPDIDHHGRRFGVTLAHVGRETPIGEARAIGNALREYLASNPLTVELKCLQHRRSVPGEPERFEIVRHWDLGTSRRVLKRD
ncbi:MAG TPA: hypothetical protein VIG32_11300 [Candidatus Baltobacteraceae bacterium]|jgi:hypothetical protein